MGILTRIVIYYLFCSFVHGENEKASTCIYGLRPIDCADSENSNGIPMFYSGNKVNMFVFGHNLTSATEIGFTDSDNCDFLLPTVLAISGGRMSAVRGELSFNPPKRAVWSGKRKYFACVKDRGETVWRHQGTGKYVSIYVADSMYSAWMYVILIALGFTLSSIMSGLNLGLLSLENSELLLLRKAGTPKEKKYAEKVIPLRKNGNYLVCSIVITLTLCNTVCTVALENLASELVTVIVSTVIIVLFCEILPQSICSTFPLQVAARTAYLTRAAMIITFPVSYPLSKVLNYVLGQEIAKSYNKERLKEILKQTDLPKHEERIITGTLDFGKKTVEQIMTNLDDIFKLPITAEMNFETIADILTSGYSRIPIYVGDKSNIRYVLLTKELALLDPDEKVPVKVLVQTSKFACQYVPKGTSLDKVFERFKDNRNHMLFVTDNEETATDSRKECVIGLVTFEDIVEEIFQMEIHDETDTLFDNREKRRISQTYKTDIISLILQPKKANALTQNVKLSTYCFLSEIEEFSVKNVSPKTLISVINLDIYYSTSTSRVVYNRGVPTDYFVMILEGIMEVKIGNEELVFEAGPFRYFGIEALRKLSPFSPDYTLQSITDTLYLKIPVPLYQAALLATRYERFMEFPNVSPKSEIYKYFNMIVGEEKKQTRTMSK